MAINRKMAEERNLSEEQIKKIEHYQELREQLYSQIREPDETSDEFRQLVLQVKSINFNLQEL